MIVKKYDQFRFFLKDTIRQQINFFETAQRQGLPAPPLQKPFAKESVFIDLPNGADSLRQTATRSVADAIIGRESVRHYVDVPLTLTEFSALLWATQGIREILSPACALRTVPSAGARHAFETYLAVNQVQGLVTGIYRYLPLQHQLLLLREDSLVPDRISEACLMQRFVAQAAVTFAWSVIPERMEWRYDLAAHKVLAIDVGHVGQNLYLACEAMGAGTCAIAAYDQKMCDELFGLDGEEEFIIYLSPVGKKLQ